MIDSIYDEKAAGVDFNLLSRVGNVASLRYSQTYLHFLATSRLLRLATFLLTTAQDPMRSGSDQTHNQTIPISEEVL